MAKAWQSGAQLLADPHTTVANDDTDNGGGVPSRIVFAKSNNEDRDEKTKATARAGRGRDGIEWDTSSSICQQVDHGKKESAEDFHARARNDIDVASLRQQIYARAAVFEQMRQQAATLQLQQQQ